MSSEPPTADVLASLSSSDIPSTALPHRPWWQLHASTWLVAMLAASFLVLLNVSAFQRFVPVPNYSVEWHYGWPLTFVRRHASYDPMTQSPRLFAMATDVIEIRGMRLIADQFVGVACVALVAAVYEWRRRRMRALWQYSLQQLAIVFVLIAVVLALGRARFVAYERQEARLSDLNSPLAGGQRLNHGMPEWLPWRWQAPFSEVSMYTVVEPGPLVSTDTMKTVADAAPEIRWLRANGIDDDGIRHVARLRDLEYLDIDNSDRLTSVGARRLSDITSLRELRMANCDRVAADGLEGFSNLTRLETLCLSSSEIGDEGLNHLRALHALTRLELANSSIGDDGVRNLAGLRRLEFLDLAGTQVADAAIAQLERMPTLKWLRLSDTDVTWSGIERLRRALPEATVICQPPPAR